MENIEVNNAEVNLNENLKNVEKTSKKKVSKSFVKVNAFKKYGLDVVAFLEQAYRSKSGEEKLAYIRALTKMNLEVPTILFLIKDLVGRPKVSRFIVADKFAELGHSMSSKIQYER